uniref:hypothetical protein n=1 Tax=Staphylococcus aureus TaxID=1280 RepID=UPI0038B3082D
ICKKEMPYMCTTEHSCVLRIRTVYNEGYDVAVQKGSSVLVCSPPDSEGFCTVQVEGKEGKLPFSLLKEVKNSS